MHDSRLRDLLQWFGAWAIIAGHLFNTLGVEYHKDFWNIVVFGLGTIAFLTWSILVSNRPHMTVNIVALVICAVGLYRAVV